MSSQDREAARGYVEIEDGNERAGIKVFGELG
jgi:hypothetical protein